MESIKRLPAPDYISVLAKTVAALAIRYEGEARNSPSYQLTDRLREHLYADIENACRAALSAMQEMAEEGFDLKAERAMLASHPMMIVNPGSLDGIPICK